MKRRRGEEKMGGVTRKDGEKMEGEMRRMKKRKVRKRRKVKRSWKE